MQNHRRPTGFAVVAGMTAALLLLFGCANGPAQRTYAYVTEATGAVAQFQIASDGTLIPLNPPTASAGYGALSLAVSPTSEFLFSGNFGNNTISQFMVGSKGTLIPNSVPSVNAAYGPYPITLTPNGQLALVASFDNTISTYGVSSSGTLSLIDTVATGLNPSSIAIDPTGRLAYVSNFQSYTISEYAISSSGMLTPSGSTPTPNYGIFDLTISPKGFLYSAGPGAGTVSEFSIDPVTGALTQLASFPNGSGEPAWISFDPTGAYAYVCNNISRTVSQFTVDATTGALTQNGPDVPTGADPMQVALDPSGKYAYTVNADGTVSEFTISSTGTLTPNGTVSLGTIDTEIQRIAFARR